MSGTVKHEDNGDGSANVFHQPTYVRQQRNQFLGDASRNVVRDLPGFPKQDNPSQVSKTILASNPVINMTDMDVQVSDEVGAIGKPGPIIPDVAPTEGTLRHETRITDFRTSTTQTHTQSSSTGAQTTHTELRNAEAQTKTKKFRDAATMADLFQQRVPIDELQGIVPNNEPMDIMAVSPVRRRSSRTTTPEVTLPPSPTIAAPYQLPQFPYAHYYPSATPEPAQPPSPAQITYPSASPVQMYPSVQPRIEYPRSPRVASPQSPPTPEPFIPIKRDRNSPTVTTPKRSKRYKPDLKVETALAGPVLLTPSRGAIVPPQPGQGVITSPITAVKEEHISPSASPRTPRPRSARTSPATPVISPTAVTPVVPRRSGRNKGKQTTYKEPDARSNAGYTLPGFPPSSSSAIPIATASVEEPQPRRSGRNQGKKVVYAEPDARSNKGYKKKKKLKINNQRKLQNPVHTEEQSKVKRPRPAAQIAAFERARAARTENLRQLSEEQKKKKKQQRIEEAKALLAKHKEEQRAKRKPRQNLTDTFFFPGRFLRVRVKKNKTKKMAVVNTAVSGSTYPMVPRNWIYESSQFGMTSDALSENIVVVRPIKDRYDSRAPGNLIQIKIDNPTSFWRPQWSYLSFKVKWFNADGSIQNNTVGAMSVIKNVTVKLGGKVSDVIDDYPELLSTSYQFETTARKKYLRHFEGYGRTDFFNTTDEGTVVRHHLQVGSLNPVNGQLIPLCLLAGNSCEISLSLNSPTYALQNAGNAYFEVSDVRMVCQIVGPSAEFLAAAHAGIQKGHYLELDFVHATQIISPLSGSSMNTIILPLTNSRVVGLSHRFRNDDTYATTTGNKERIYNDAGLLSYR
ncbi:hypothetical protein BC832DRAFT_542936 [Gaertneriomyces semiglobifer]|nr:hypothetical protein BC832DRAFT_542936 [Gaertneriomyces semiglobifer]